MTTLDQGDIDAIARRVVELLLPALSGDGGQPSHADPPASAPSQRLVDWLRATHPDALEAIHSPLEAWAPALVEAAAGTDAVGALEWAWSADCPTPYWRERHRPIALPARRGGDRTRRSDGGYRYGPWLQLLAEYRLSTGPRAEHLHQVDALVDQVVAAVKSTGDRPAAVSVTSRKNALAILADSDDGPDTVLEIVRWCLAAKPHWRGNLTGVPRVTTYRSMRGDWKSSGQGFRVEDIVDESLRTEVRDLGNGWAWYLSQALGQQVEPSPRTFDRLHTLLTGHDGDPAVPCQDAKDTVRWLCDPSAGRARYYTDSLDFPRPERARKALLDMRSGPQVNGGVVGTNAAAADMAGDYADDDLKGML